MRHSLINALNFENRAYRKSTRSTRIREDQNLTFFQTSSHLQVYRTAYGPSPRIIKKMRRDKCVWKYRKKHHDKF
jgi:hypothetical protein